MKFKTSDQLFKDLFVDVQMSGIFPDSKTFADAIPLSNPEQILTVYQSRKGNENFKLRDFVAEFFQMPHKYASGFQHDPTKSTSEHINSLWGVLKRKADEEVPGSSLIPLPHPYIVPGGRFGEIYYWDSYFTMLGLAQSGEFDMIESMLDNFAYLINQVGHIPNGNRTYFISRSQPPFFSSMVDLLSGIRGQGVIDKYKNEVLKEYQFWMQSDRCVKIGEAKVNRYWDDSAIPRQESYPEDVELAGKSNRDPEDLYLDLRAACESGWDFSSRWCDDPMDLGTIKASKIIPVDLNCLLYKSERLLLAAFEGSEIASSIQSNMVKRHAFLNSACWNGEIGVYEDFSLETNKRTGRPTAATFFPLFFGLASEEQAEYVAKFGEKHLLKSGGLVTTPLNSGQQWDAPNGWAPLQWIAVVGLMNYHQNDLAFKIGDRWIELNDRVYKSQGKMVEKYNVEDLDMDAGGGEYDLQDGFGWTNGVYLALKDLI